MVTWIAGKKSGNWIVQWFIDVHYLSTYLITIQLLDFLSTIQVTIQLTDHSASEDPNTRFIQYLNGKSVPHLGIFQFIQNLD